MGAASQAWAVQIDAEWAAKMGDLREVVIYIASEALSRVKVKSPVDTGHFKANWVVSLGRQDGTIIPFPGDLGPRNASALGAYASAEGYPVIYVQNNLPYANKLEHGHSGQAPAGMVAITVAELEALMQGREV